MIGMKRIQLSTFCLWTWLWFATHTASAWTTTSTPTVRPTLPQVRLKASSAQESSASIVVEPCSGEPVEIARVADFFVNSFWLGSSRQMTTPMEDVDTSKDALALLVQTQSEDFDKTYGERMGGERDSMLWLAKDSNQDVDNINDTLLGMVGLDVTLMERSTNSILKTDQAHDLVQNAVASLGPKQRRAYKDASFPEKAEALLGNDYECVAQLCNLAVAPTARRRGVARALCDQVLVVAEQAGLGAVVLQVEKDNAAARHLYQQTLGFDVDCVLVNETVLRANPLTGGFEAQTADALVLSKRFEL